MECYSVIELQIKTTIEMNVKTLCSAKAAEHKRAHPL